MTALLASLGGKPNPVMGAVTSSTGVGLAGAAITVLNAAKAVVASTPSDSTGFYFIAKTSVFATGGTYTVKMASPKPYKSSTPVSQTFVWSRNQITLGNFTLK